MNELISNAIDVSEISDLFNPHALIYLVTMLGVFVIGKWVYDLFTPYKLNEQLVEVDNRAVAVAFAGYLLGLGIILEGVVSQESTNMATGSARRDLLLDVGDTLLWGVIGIVLLQLARLINDKLLLNTFSNTKELVEDKNVGTGAVEFGSFVGSALIIRVLLMGEGHGILTSIVETVVYFLAAQAIFVLFGKVYQMVTRYDVHKEIERDNAAAGVSLGLSLIAVSVLVSSYLSRYDSLPGLALWFLIGTVLLLGCRYLVDKFLLPGRLLDDEVGTDRNWGAALIEGGSAVALAALIGASF
jgi:uncharacterized membrane protein YjfL (UPF0719 family)